MTSLSTVLSKLLKIAHLRQFLLRVSLETVIRVLPAKKIRAEAKEYDTNAISVYLSLERQDAKNSLAGHVLIELSRLMTSYSQASADNLLTATVTEKRKRVGLVVLAKYTGFTQELKILKRELNERGSR